MNTIFSIKRFYKLIKLHFSLHKKTLLLELSAFTALAFVVTGIVLANSTEQSLSFNWISIFYMLIILFVGNYFASTTFSYFHQTKRATDILLPASTFEKFMLPNLFTGVIFLLIFSIYFWILARLVTLFWMPVYGFAIHDFPLINNNSKDIISVVLPVYLLIHPLFLTGSLCFKKNSFFLTGLVLFLLLLVFSYYGHFLSKTLFDSEKFAQTAIDANVSQKPILWGVAILFNIVFSTAAFFKLKEKEV